MDLAKDLLSISFPPVSPRIEIPLGEVLLDISNQLSHTGEASFANAILCDVSEESLHKVEPRTACGGEVYLETTVSCQPFLYVFLLVGAVVVDDEVDVHIIGRLSVDLLEEPQPLDVCVLILGAAYDLAIKVIESGEESDRAMTSVVMGCSPAVAACAKGQCRLRTFERLALALLIATKHEGLCRRVEIQADDIPELLLESRVVGEFECLGDVRLDIVGPPNSVNGVRGDADMRRHRPGAPALHGRWRRGGLGNNAVDDVIGYCRRPTPSLGVRQALKPVTLEALRPAVDHGQSQSKPRSDILLSHPLGAKKNYLRPGMIPLADRRTLDTPSELPLFIGSELEN